MKRLSELFKKSILGLYKQGIYSIYEAITQASYQLDKKRLTESDFEELMSFFENELAKEEEVVEPTIEDEMNEENNFNDSESEE